MSGSNLQDDGGNDSNRPTKRAKTDERNFLDTNDRHYRRRSPPQESRRSDYYKPYVHISRPGPPDRYVPNYKDRNSRQPRHRSMSPDRRMPADNDAQLKNKKSQRDRKENPSTRIHSLRRLLRKVGLPASVQQEKERELAALLFDQQKEVIRRGSKKNLKRYHFIRFVERQKATRTVKQLKKQQAAGDVSEDLLKQIHEAEVDLNYALYTPLADKYIALYARDESKQGKPLPLARNLSRMKKADYDVLSDDQRYQLEQACLEVANMLHLGDSARGMKPPGWYVVEARMKEGQKALEELRDQQAKVDLKSELVTGMGSNKTPGWLEDDGMINPEDLDSDFDENGDVGIDENDVDEEMSDGDGGFFEKR